MQKSVAAGIEQDAAAGSLATVPASAAPRPTASTSSHPDGPASSASLVAAACSSGALRFFDLVYFVACVVSDPDRRAIVTLNMLFTFLVLKYNINKRHLGKIKKEEGQGAGALLSNLLSSFSSTRRQWTIPY